MRCDAAPSACGWVVGIDAGATKTARKKKIPNAAPRSEREREEMEQAEKEGRARAKELDPAEDVDYSRPTK